MATEVHQQKKPPLFSTLPGYPVGLIGLAAMGGLAGRAYGDVGVAIGFGVALAVALVFTGLLLVLLSRANRDIRDRHGFRGILVPVGRGLIMTLPLAAIGIAAELAFSWDCTQVFGPAALAALAYGAGGDVIRLGGPRIRNMVIPGILAVVFSLIWSLATILPEML